MIKLLQRLICNDQQRRIDELESEVDDLERQLDAARQAEDWPELDTVREDKSFVENALHDLDGWGTHHTYWWDDRIYNLPTRDGFGRVVLHDEINERPYKDEVYDCDNYSDHLVSLFADRYTCNAVGTVITQDGEPHAFNVVVFPDGAELWEPGGGEYEQGFVTDSDLPEYSLNGAFIRI